MTVYKLEVKYWDGNKYGYNTHIIHESEIEKTLEELENSSVEKTRWTKVEEN